MSTLCALHR